MERQYDVALWLCPPGEAKFPDYIGMIRASFPLDAVVVLMKRHRVSVVLYAAVSFGDGLGIARFKRGVKIFYSERVHGFSMASKP